MPKTKKLIPYLKRIEQSGQYSNFGPLEREVRYRLQTYIGDERIYVATCNSATVGLLGMLNIIKKYDSQRWLVPSWTFSATISAALHSSLDFRFCDVDLTTMVMKSEFLESENNKLVVAPFGARINEILNSNNGKHNLLIDAAASFGSLKNLKSKDQSNWACVVSLHATKNLGSGEGGFVFSKNKEWIDNFIEWTNFGFDSQRISNNLGFNGKLSEYNAAVVLANLDNWENTYNKLSKLVHEESRIMNSIDLEKSPVIEQKLVTPYWVIRLKNNKALENTKLTFQNHGIETREWWAKGCHLMNAYRDIPVEGGLENTNVLANTVLGIPHHVNITKKEINKMGELLHNLSINNFSTIL
jgi:dTDP-4-amino-4,6-dideoxygalactose transaminase